MKVTLNISKSIINEWKVRCIGDVIPHLADMEYVAKMEVTEECCKEIIADCEFNLHPLGPETTPGEKRAYKALLKQCKNILTSQKNIK